MKKALFILIALMSLPIFASMPDLKNGVLLVRLESRNQEIDYYKDKDPEYAARVREEVAESQKELYNAFVSEYSYSEVLFYYSDDAQLIKDKKYVGNVYDKDLKAVKKFNYSPDQVYIARVGSTMESPIHVAALVLYNAEFRQLDKPFPYYVRTLEEFFFLERSKNELIRRFNQKLAKYERKRKHSA